MFGAGLLSGSSLRPGGHRRPHLLLYLFGLIRRMRESSGVVEIELATG